MFRNVVVHMNGRSAYHTASAGGQVPSPMWVSSQLAAVRRQLHGSIAPQHYWVLSRDFDINWQPSMHFS